MKGIIIVYNQKGEDKFLVDRDLLKVDINHRLIYKEEIAKLVDQEFEGKWSHFEYIHEPSITMTTVYQKFPRGRE